MTRFLLKISIITILLAPNFIFAQNYVPLAPIPGYVKEEPANLTNYLTGIYQFGIAAAGILAVLMLVWGGFKYATSEAVSGKGEGKEIIQGVVWGGAIVLGSWILLFTINPKLVDVGLAIKGLNPVMKEKIPNPEETYGKFLDDALRKAKSISTKAKDLHGEVVIAQNAVARLISNLDNGVYEDEDGNPLTQAELEQKISTLQTKTTELQKKEVSVRKYENTDLLLTDAREQIRQCLNGLGACSVVKVNKSSAVGAFLTGGVFEPITGVPGFIEVTYDNTASKDVAKNNAAAQLIVQSARLEVNANKAMLIQNGLTEQAAALENKMVDIENRTAFNIRCPNSTKTYVPNKGMETAPCP